MFGTARRSSADTTWANFNAKTGLFQLGNKDNRKEHDLLADVMIRRVMIMEQPNFDDKSKMDKIIALSAKDLNGSDVVVKFAMSQFAVKVLGLLRAADLTKPITLRGGAFEEGTEKTDVEGATSIREKAEPFLIAYQGDEKIKASFSDDPEFKIPKVDNIEAKHPITGVVIATVKDYTARNEFILAFAQEITAKVDAAVKKQPAITKKDTPAPHQSDAVADPALSAADFAGAQDGGESDAEQFRPAA